MEDFKDNVWDLLKEFGPEDSHHANEWKAHVTQEVGKVLAHKKEVSKRIHELSADQVQINVLSQDDGRQRVDIKKQRSKEKESWDEFDCKPG